MKAIKGIGAIILYLSLLLGACEENGEHVVSESKYNEQKTEEIYGESFLKVINESPKGTRVYFNEKFIGVVGVGTNRIWNVPVGRHNIKLYNYMRSACCADLYFSAGEYTNVCSRQNMEDDPDFVYEDACVR